MISKIELPRNKVEVQSFLGKVNFLRIFIAAFAEIVKYIIDMLGKDKEIKWTLKSKQSFGDIKKAISEVPILSSPDFSKEFLIFSFPQSTQWQGYRCRRIMRDMSNDMGM